MSSKTCFLVPALALVMMSGCINEVVYKPVTTLDYKHIAPVYVSAGRVEIVNQYHPSMASDKAASTFPTRPEDSLNHYAENRLKSKGYEGVLKFIIKDATVTESVAQPDSAVMKWAGTGIQDRFDVSLKVTLSKLEGNGHESSHADITVTRFITVPRGYSIAKKQATMRDFMERIITEVDGMVTSALQGQMHMTITDGGGAVAPAPDSGDQQNSANSGVSDGPAVPAAPVSSVKPEALPPPW